eukprot:1140734-Pelagomonas_calceolata.AAC.7
MRCSECLSVPGHAHLDMRLVGPLQKTPCPQPNLHHTQEPHGIRADIEQLAFHVCRAAFLHAMPPDAHNQLSTGIGLQLGCLEPALVSHAAALRQPLL